MSEIPIVKTFEVDHIVRDIKGMPLGRIILIDDDVYDEGEPINVALLTVPLSKTKKVQGLTYYVDGHPYRIPLDLSNIKTNQVGDKHLVNNFVLKPEKS